LAWFLLALLANMVTLASDLPFEKVRGMIRFIFCPFIRIIYIGGWVKKAASALNLMSADWKVIALLEQIISSSCSSAGISILIVWFKG
jgi:disulfide bond formation protein DsbB